MRPSIGFAAGTDQGVLSSSYGFHAEWQLTSDVDESKSWLVELRDLLSDLCNSMGTDCQKQRARHPLTAVFGATMTAPLSLLLGFPSTVFQLLSSAVGRQTPRLYLCNLKHLSVGGVNSLRLEPTKISPLSFPEGQVEKVTLRRHCSSLGVLRVS